MEGYRHKIAGFWSLDMRERVVREKFGSGLVVFSMFLHLEATSNQMGLFTGKDEEVAKFVELGETLLPTCCPFSWFFESRFSVISNEANGLALTFGNDLSKFQDR